MKILRAAFTAGLLVVSVVGNLRADDNLRHYQQALRDQGFYYGPVDGSAGDETTQALRRYQIRNGLAVTGQLDDDTRRSIDHAAADAAQSTPGPLATPPPPPPAAPQSQPRRPAPTPIPRPVPPQEDQGNQGPPPSDPGNTQPDGPRHVAPSAPLTNYFGGTPYEFAPPPVQSDAIARAQKLLTRTGFYDGEVNGRPNHDLADAVSNFQEVNRLRRSGRLDTNTLAAMRLLPDRREGGPGRRPYPDDPRRDAGGVYEGRIVH